MMSQPTVDTDVLICGGGPVGLLTAYCLSRYGVSTIVIEKHSEVKKVQYGRAVLMMPRTLELLDQLDLADALGQIGFICRGQHHYKDGKRLEGHGAGGPAMPDTFFEYVLMCRQRWTEQVIADAYTKMRGTGVEYGMRLLNFEIHEQPGDNGSDQTGVRSTIETQAGQKTHINSKYIIGADGGQSTVRELAGIAFEGERSNRRWVRIDGIVETDMPDARCGLASIHSATHGSILWGCLDHGATRVGFALPEKRWGAGENISLEDVIIEAKEALRPFSLEFKAVDWWTVYAIGQRLAANYRAQGRLFLVGDAAHTHSSAGAQGMNIGLQDAVNLAWKLAGRIRGQFRDRILDTYSTERRSVAEHIIAQDKILALLTDNKIPPELQDDPEKEPYKLLTRTYMKNQDLHSGLGIVYAADDLTIVRPTTSTDLKVQVGGRAPDVLLQRPGIRVPVRLYSQNKNHGKFTVVVFCGDPSKTRDLVKKWGNYLDSAEGVLKYEAAIIDLVTILVSDNDIGAAEEHLGILTCGQVFYDTDGSAHERYGVPIDKGAVLILRPDGLVGTACALDEGDVVSTYFARFLTVKKQEDPTSRVNGDMAPTITKGEVELE